MAGIACHKCTRDDVVRGINRPIIETLSKALAYRIDRPPRDFFHVQCIGMENFLSLRDEVFVTQVKVRNPFIFVDHIQLDIEPT